MKISNNALNFLLAQYRAIFKRAYVKGIASAVLLTAGLAMGQAQADQVTDIATINDITDDIFEIDGDATTGNNQLALQVSSGDTLGKDLNITVGDKIHRIQTATSATDGSTVILDAKNHNITISDDDVTDGAFAFGSTAAKSKLQIKDLGTLTIDGAKVNLTTPNSTQNSGSNQVGVDVGAKAAIYEIMGDLAQQGYAIVMISSEMPEILGMCDRVFVMCDGRVTGELDRKEASQELILELAMSKSRAGQTA